MDKFDLDNAKTVEEVSGEIDPSPEIRYLRGETKEQLRIINKLKERIGQLEQMEGRIVDALQTLPPPKPVNIPVPGMSHAESDAFLALTDLHAEEYVDEEEMEGFASYDWDTFLSRMWSTGEKTVELTNIMRKAGPVSRLKVACLGDVLTGNIHLELDRTNTFDLPIAVVKVGNIMAQLINGLSAHFDEVEISCVCGNHGRQDEKPTYKGKADRNWDTAVYRIVSLLTQDNNKIKWNIPRSPSIIVSVAGAEILIKHGDGIKMSGTTPFYGLARDTAQEHSKRRGDRDFDFILQGHLHTFTKIEERILAPAMIGTNQFAFNRLHSVPVPQQLLMFSTAKNDLGITNFWPIDLSKAEGHGFNDSM